MLLSCLWLFCALFKTAFVLLIKKNKPSALWRWSPNIWSCEMNGTQLSGINIGINIAACASFVCAVICWVNSAAESWSLSVHPAKCGLWNPPFLSCLFILSGMKGRRGQSPQHLKADYIRSLLCAGQRGRASGVGWEAAGVTRGVTTEESRKWWGAVEGGREGGTGLSMQICIGGGLRRCFGDIPRCM